MTAGEGLLVLSRRIAGSLCLPCLSRRWTTTTRTNGSWRALVAVLVIVLSLLPCTRQTEVLAPGTLTGESYLSPECAAGMAEAKAGRPCGSKNVTEVQRVSGRR